MFGLLSLTLSISLASIYLCAIWLELDTGEEEEEEGDARNIYHAPQLKDWIDTAVPICFMPSSSSSFVLE